MIDPIKVAQAVEKYKISVVCASCNKYWQARDRGLPEPQCLSNTCASPIGGGNFEDYEGPIPDFKIWCFVCGGSCTKFMFVKNKPRLFGICDLHLEEAKTLAPIDVQDPASLERYYIENNQIKPLNICATQFFKKQTLHDLMIEGETTAKKKGLIHV